MASVPLETKRTIWIDGIAVVIASASSTSPGVGIPKLVPRAACSAIAATTAGCACPAMSGPHEQTRST